MKQKYLLIPIMIIVIVAVASVLLGSSSKLSTSPAACVNHDLAGGSNGHCVRDAQIMLNWSLYGIDGPNDKPVTGTFSSVTITELQSFESSNDLSKSATLSHQTWLKLCSNNSDAPDNWYTAAKDAGCDG